MQVGLTLSQKKMLIQTLKIFKCLFKKFLQQFPLKKVHINHDKKAWLTKGIIISRQQKRDLYILHKTTHDPCLKICYKKYTKILFKVIKVAKKCIIINYLVVLTTK